MKFNGEDAESSELVSICLGYNINDSFNFMIESYTYFSDHVKPEHYIDAGFAFLLRKNLQIDILSDISMTNIKHYFMFSCGMSFRLPD